ncbi:MAG TPA: hypothetical protein VK559_11590 [Ferruginibacter sp.]|nr:hypothetical protein [Ferruginibacter sp.]
MNNLIVFLAIHSIFRIMIMIITTIKAKELNRNQFYWGSFGFVFPLVAIISIRHVKYNNLPLSEIIHWEGIGS